MQKHVTPYSQNIIFLDTEFSDLNARTGELLSVGLITYSGKELYLELEHSGPVHPWVKKHVLPLLIQPKVSREVAKEKLTDFIGKDKPYLVSYVNQFDAIYWYDLFGSPKNHPCYWIPIDFASILFATGYDPNSLGKKRFFDELSINKKNYTFHSALDDARLLRDVYIKFFQVWRSVYLVAVSYNSHCATLFI